MRRTLTRRTQFQADYEKVFEFLAAVENMPRWTVFAQEVKEAGGGRYEVKTPQGDGELWIEAQRAKGDVVYHWIIGGMQDFAPTNLRQENGHIVYTFTIQDPPGAPEGTLEQLAKVVEAELEALKTIAETELS